MSKHIQMIWIDKNKNSLFNLSVKSWISHGYTIDLYTDNLEIVDHPQVNCIDIKEIDHEFTDNARYKLLYEKGGMYVDSDLVLINDYDFSKEKYIISSEGTLKAGYHKKNEDFVPTITLLKFPAKDPFIKLLIQKIDKTIKNSDDVCQCQKLFQRQLKTQKYKYLNEYVKRPISFCGINSFSCKEMYKDVGIFQDKYGVIPLPVSNIFKHGIAIHFWNNISHNKFKISFDKAENGSVYQILCERYKNIII